MLAVGPIEDPVTETIGVLEPIELSVLSDGDESVFRLGGGELPSGMSVTS